MLAVATNFVEALTESFAGFQGSLLQVVVIALPIAAFVLLVKRGWKLAKNVSN